MHLLHVLEVLIDFPMRDSTFYRVEAGPEGQPRILERQVLQVEALCAAFIQGVSCL